MRVYRDAGESGEHCVKLCVEDAAGILSGYAGWLTGYAGWLTGYAGWLTGYAGWLTGYAGILTVRDMDF